MAISRFKVHDGKKYYSIAAAAKLAGTIPRLITEIISTEGIEYRNFEVNGSVYISAEEFDLYLKRRVKLTNG